MSYQFTPLQLAWIEALESGKYLQAKNRLTKISPESHCCLGVACVVFEKNTGKELIKERVEELEGDSCISYNGLRGVLHDDVREELRLYGSDGVFLNDFKNLKSLAEMNDAGNSHKQIAEYIRANPENVFRQ